jgi:16S rRNA (adenine1518-N6/adenine1519-N6)-dimethyltransferase
MTGRSDRRRTLSPSGRRAAKKELGQHFLVDENLLGVIDRMAALSPDDVVLEVGPGLGVLTSYLADRTKRVHAVELDRSLEPRLREALADRANVELHFGDALRIDLAALDPAPTKLVSNLPYNIATPLVVESLDGMPSLELWCVMVQREVADRFFARPSTKEYGAVSVLVQLAADRSGFHAVSREVFRPRPNVDSALVAFRRRELPAACPRVKELVAAAFAHRRKRLANSLELSGLADREKAATALETIGRDPRARAEELAPAEFVALARELGPR